MLNHPEITTFEVNTPVISIPMPSVPLPGTVLIANRGEIAVRILRTVHSLGLAAIAVHTEEDSGAAHVAAADRAVQISSYLDGAEIIAAALATGARAIHPGYGFLSERADFARACEQAGLVFVGPSAAAIEIMGDKISARAAVTARGVPVVPGLAAPGLDDAALLAGAAEIGFPLLVKPAAGGGGKGMHRVETPAELPAALAAARREAAGAFGDDTLFLERWITAPKHIEVQVLADTHGTVIHLGSGMLLQRRHQKVIEEAPSPSLTPDQREQFGRVAVEAARAVDYVGAGTVEFIVDGAAPEAPFFLEMNTRLQVEHAVTEAITGIDLVAEQLRIASGEPLSLTQEDVRLEGHAIEARLYAEDPAAGFLPTGGTVLALALPEGARVDHALSVGATISSSYDPMLAKVITHAATRDRALAALDRALEQTHLLGVVTNTAFLRALLALDEVKSGDMDTGLIERRLDELTPPPVSARALAVAALVRWEHVARSRSDDLWHAPTGWRLGARAPFLVRFAAADGTDGAGGAGGVGSGGAADGTGADHGAVPADDGPVVVSLTGSPEQARATVGEQPFALALHAGAVTVDGIRLPLLHHGTDSSVWIGLPGEDRELSLHRPVRGAAGRDAAPTLASPMPGTVTMVLVADGDHVDAGDPVLVVEAMKMEHTLSAPSSGTVHLRVGAGDRVARGEEVAQVVPEEAGLEVDGRETEGPETEGPDHVDQEAPPMTDPDTDPVPDGPRIIQRGLYADELQIRAIYEHRPGRTLTEADNVLFSTMTMNPQALHLDAAWSETTEFGQRLVNSMLTLATVVGASVAQLTQGTLVANLGFGEISFPRPLHHGDTLYSETQVLAVRPSNSRPGQAVVTLVHTGRNQYGEVVVRAERTTLMHASASAHAAPQKHGQEDS